MHTSKNYLILHTLHGPKKRGNVPQKRGNRSKNWGFKTFFENRKLTQKRRNEPQKTGNKSNVNIAETNPKYSEIPQHFSVFKGFPIILEKRRKRTQTHCWVRSVLRRFHSTDLSFCKFQRCLDESSNTSNLGTRILLVKQIYRERISSKVTGPSNKSYADFYKLPMELKTNSFPTIKP